MNFNSKITCNLYPYFNDVVKLVMTFFYSTRTVVEIVKKQHINTQVINYKEKYFLIVHQKFEQLSTRPTRGDL